MAPFLSQGTGMTTARPCLHGKQRQVCRECKQLGIGGNSICVHDRQKPQCSICSPKGTYNYYKHSSSYRGHSFGLTFEEFVNLVSRSCFYCGEQDSPRGIDRWENEIGYEFFNCRSCCKTCNYFKRKLSGHVFIERCQRIANTNR